MIALSGKFPNEISERLVLAGTAGAAVIEIASILQTDDLLLDVRHQATSYWSGL